MKTSVVHTALTEKALGNSSEIQQNQDVTAQFIHVNRGKKRQTEVSSND